jgi:hypothetical protein
VDTIKQKCKCGCGCGKLVESKTCLNCGALFFPLHSSKGKYCSSKCCGVSRKASSNPSWKGGKIERVCIVCGKSFYVYPSELKRNRENIALYCSKSCKMKCLNKISVENGSHNLINNTFNKGKSLSNEIKRELSLALTGKYVGVNNPFYGKNHSKITKDKISISHKGKIISKETKIKMSKATSGKNNPRFGTKCSFPYYYRKSGVRSDIGMYFRSTWEANIARFFNYIGFAWQYEPERFFFENMTYLPDFYLPHIDRFVEVKGFWRADCRKKVDLFIKKYGKSKLWIIDSQNYNKINIMYKNIIPEWED